LRNKYIPTPGEKKLLRVLADPTSIDLSITKICNLAGVSRNKYYDAIQNEQFVEYLNELTFKLVKGKIGNVLNASYRRALQPNGFQDGKLLLTMAGYYTDKQDVNVKGDINNPFQDLTTEELKKLIRK